MVMVFVLLAAWEPVSDKHGYSVERRPVVNETFYELRVRVHVTCQAEKIFAVAWDTPSYPKFVKHAKLVKVLREQGNERITYQQNAIPIIKDRDYTLRAWFEKDPVSGLIQMWWTAANNEGPPEQPDYARVRKTGGSWTLEPTADGGTDVTYVVASEAGGAVPAWILRAAQADAAPEFVRTIVTRACS